MSRSKYHGCSCWLCRPSKYHGYQYTASERRKLQDDVDDLLAEYPWISELDDEVAS